MQGVVFASLLTFTALGAVLLAWVFRQHSSRPKPVTAESKSVTEEASTSTENPSSGVGAESVHSRVHELAFATEEVRETLRHQEVVESVSAGLDRLLEDESYAPRQPMVLPKLMRALRNEENQATDLVKIILEDPGLTGDVLKMANSPVYRIKNEPIDTVDYALVVLGIDGLKSVIATSLMQPIFQCKSRLYEGLPEQLWERAIDGAYAAQTFASQNGGDSDKSFSAHLCSLISHLAQIVLCRYTEARYLENPDLTALPGTFIDVMQRYTHRMALDIMDDWEIASVAQGLTEVRSEEEFATANTLSQAVSIGQYAGQIALLVKQDGLAVEEVYALLAARNVSEKLTKQMLRPTLRQLAEEDEAHAA